jgi:ATP-dependent Clp protease ATP-binding subunit ClpA
MEIEDLIMELFADRSSMLCEIFADIIGDENKVDELLAEVTKKFKPAVVAEIKELEECDALTNLNKWVKDHPQVVIDADGPVSKIEMALAGRSIRNVCLTGKAGTGKTQYVYEFVQRIVRGNVPEEFKDKVVYEVSTGALMAGTRFRGDLEERIQNILDLVKEQPNVILFIDELHSFLNAGNSGDDGQGCGQLIKPYLTRGEVQIIGATTNEEYVKHVLKDKAFSRRFHEVKIEEPNKEAIRKILEGILPTETEYFKREIQTELVDRVLDLSQKYSLDMANPAKAINMLELACAYSKVFEEKKEAVDVNSVIESVKLKYNIYISDDKIKDTKAELFRVLLGQDDALNQVIRNMKSVDRGVVELQKPLMSMLFAGPSGTGKTETAKILAKTFFGSEENLIKISMGEYSTEQDVSKLSGSAPGLVGYDDEPALIKGVREKPNSIVLFDEIEKAHPSVQKIILNILDEGEMKDNKGNSISFRNCVIIFTTNLGCTKDTGKAVGSGFIKSVSNSGTSNEIMKAIENYFRPEFLGRLDDIVMFNSLPESIIRTLIDRYLNEYKEQCGDLNVTFNEDDYKEIIKEANIGVRGARGVRKAVKKQIIKVEDRD